MDTAMEKREKFSAAIFRRGAKMELFGDGQESAFDEQQELQGKLQELHDVWSLPRTGKDVSAAIWRPKQRVAEVVLQKGKLMSHMGFMQGSRLHLNIEEAVYLLDRANLLLFVECQRGEKRPLSLHEAQELMLGCGISMHFYLVYCKLMRTGYIVQRHPSCWMLKPSENVTAIWPLWYQQSAAQPATQVGSKRQREASTSGVAAGGAKRPAPTRPVDAAARTGFANMVPLAQLSRDDVVEAEEPGSGKALLGLDVFTSNAHFSRKAPGDPLFCVVVSDSPSPPTLQQMCAADLAATPIPVRYASVERGDIALYAVAGLELKGIHRRA